MASEPEPAGTPASTVLASLAANGVIFVFFVGGFSALRLKLTRIYSPKTSCNLMPRGKIPDPLPRDPFRWLLIMLAKSDRLIIRQCGLDGYFFLRYIFVMASVSLAGMLIWIVLFSVNITGGARETGFDQISITNITESDSLYAHAIMSLVFYGSVIFVIHRELTFFNAFRALVLSSPKYASKRSSRTVLFNSVPEQLRNEKQMKRLFTGVRSVYIPRHTRKLRNKIHYRKQLALKLELETTQLLQRAVKAKTRAEDKHLVVANPSDLSTWIPQNKRIQVRKAGLFSDKVDLIEKARQDLIVAQADVIALQKQYTTMSKRNTVFVEFEDQCSAQLAFQAIVHQSPTAMHPRYTGVEPDEIDWINMRLIWWERIIRKYSVLVAVLAVALFWAIPVSAVSAFFSLEELAKEFKRFRFVNKLPKWFVTAMTGILPTMVLELLLTVVAGIIRMMARIAGSVSTQETEHFTHDAYFVFLVINGFIVTAFSSSAIYAATSIIETPTKALLHLAKDSPRSCNFFLTYLALQGLVISSIVLFQLVNLFLYYVIGAIFDKTLRQKWVRFSGLENVSWGSAFPPIISLTSITMVYAIISPIILLFSCAAFGLLYVAWCHNLIYVFVEKGDSRGSHYPKALFQTFTGIYLGQCCLIGLLVSVKVWGPVSIQGFGIFCTVFAHLELKKAFGNLLAVVPVDCMRSKDEMPNFCLSKQDEAYSGDSYSQEASVKGTELDHMEFNERILQKYEGLEQKKSQQKVQKQENPDQEKFEQEEVNEGEHFDNPNQIVSKNEHFSELKNSNILMRYFRPDHFSNLEYLRSLIPLDYYEVDTSTEDPHAYDQPEATAQMPVLWIPRDPMGWSQQEIERNKGIVDMRDENSSLTRDGRITFHGAPPFGSLLENL